MGNVGRTWYVQLTQGRLGAVVELGTKQVGTKPMVWHRLDVRSAPEHPSEDDIISELYSGLLEILEARTYER